jgi:hypothetical protein
MAEKDQQRALTPAEQITSETTSRAIPDAGEVYLRLAAVDLDNTNDVLRFMKTYGLLDVRRAGLDPHADLIYYGLALEPTSGRRIEELAAGRQRIEGELHTSGRLGQLGSVHETLDELLFAARSLRDLLTAWRVISGQLHHRDAVWASDVWQAPRNDDETIMAKLNTNPWEPGGPERLLSGYLEDGLSSFSPRVTFDTHQPAKPGVDPPMYANLCLELFNHIVENAAYRVCANEPCQRMFVRQTGRAQHGQHRTTGVRFCSSTCARAQSQREYRRRQRSKRDQL